MLRPVLFHRLLHPRFNAANLRVRCRMTSGVLTGAGGRHRSIGAPPRRAVDRAFDDVPAERLGPEAQRAAIESWAASRGVTVVAWFEDLGVSGGAAIDRCPGLLAAMEAVKEHRAGALVVQKRDRLARDIIKAAVAESMVERSGARIVTTEGEESGDADPNAWLMKTLKDAFGQYERLVIGARTKAALSVKRARGERVGEVPYGYRVAADGVRLEVEPEEQAIVARIRALRRDGLSLRAIAAEVNGDGARQRSGRPFHPQTVKNIAEREPVAV